MPVTLLIPVNINKKLSICKIGIASEKSLPKNHGTKIGAISTRPKHIGIPKKNVNLKDLFNALITTSLFQLLNSLEIFGTITMLKVVITVISILIILKACS